jgi:hypothetical protein
MHNPPLNGCDYLMAGFDYELRRSGFAGNSCMSVLELSGPISTDQLRERLRALHEPYAILSARRAGALLPRWNLKHSHAKPPAVHQHQDAPNLLHRLFNTPLQVRRGELMRFDVIETSGASRLAFTWWHPLMDARSAEHFIAMVGRHDVPLPDPDATGPKRPTRKLRERVQLAWKSLHLLDEFCKAPPRTLPIRHSRAPAELRFRTERFSAEETARARSHGVKLCGALGDAQFHGVASVMELHRLHQRLGRPSPSYVLPIPVALRPKGSVDPLFSNQITMLMTQFLPEHVETADAAIAVLKAQTERSIRSGFIDSGLMLSELFRFLPLPLYMAMLKKGLKGEICSMFYGNTAAVNPLVTTFLGVPVVEFTHVAAVTPSPGIGVIFHYFRGELRLTVVHSAKMLNDAEAADFAARLRERLLNP